jgi:hypothetical protein
VKATEIRETAAEAWLLGHPILENYRTLHAQAVDRADPRYTGGFGCFRHYPEPFGPQNTDIVTPNNDTPYSWAWLDLRAEPWIVSVPAIDRYYLLPFHDLDTTYVGYVGARATGPGPGHYLLAGPDWEGPHPSGISGVLHAQSQLVGCLGRTYLAGTGPAQVRELAETQKKYSLTPLHEFADTDSPPPSPLPAWPTWDEERVQGLDFFGYLDFLLGFFPPPPEQAELRARLAELGVTGDGRFDAAALGAEAREAMVRGMDDARARVKAAEAVTDGSRGLFGTRRQLGEDYLKRSVAADLGLYGLPQEEAWYGGWLNDDQGGALDASAHEFRLRFARDALPRAEFFWSATLYRLPERLLVANPIGRYSIGDRTPGLVRDEDGGLTLHISHTAPATPKWAANWLPAPDGPFTVVLRVYGPGHEIADGTWTLPPLTRVS